MSYTLRINVILALVRLRRMNPESFLLREGFPINLPAGRQAGMTAKKDIIF